MHDKPNLSHDGPKNTNMSVVIVFFFRIYAIQAMRNMQTPQPQTVYFCSDLLMEKFNTLENCFLAELNGFIPRIVC